MSNFYLFFIYLIGIMIQNGNITSKIDLNLKITVIQLKITNQ